MSTQHLLDDNNWLAWVTNEGSSPGSLRIEVEAFRYEGQAVKLAAEEVAGSLARLLSQHGIPNSDLEGKLFAACDDIWLSWSNGQLVKCEQLPEERRSRGGILLALGEVAGNTLNAVATQYAFRLPDTPHALFRAIFDDGSRTLREYTDKLDYLEGRCQREVTDSFNWALELTEQADDWLTASPTDAWQVFARRIAGGVAKQFEPSFSKRKLGRILSPSPEDDGTQQDKSSSGKSNERKKFEEWLSDELDGTGLEFDDVRDSGLEVIYEGQRGWRIAGNPVYFCRQRLAAYLEYRDSIGGRDFDNLAPVPHIGARRNPTSPGLPLLDALWAARALQEAFPGRMSTDGDTDLRIRSVSLALYDAEADGRRQPEKPARRCYLTGGNERGIGLRRFGINLLERLENAERVSGTDTEFFVCFELADPQLDAPVELPVAFPWRFERRGLQRQGERVRALNKDRNRFADVAEQLRHFQLDNPRFSKLGGCRDELVRRLVRLQEEWERFPGVVDDTGFGEEAGLQQRVGASAEVEIWDVAEAFIAAYANVLASFTEIFRVAGDLAPRIAARPLDQFLQFGLLDARRDETDDAIRIFGYHPLRLLRLARMEREAFEELCEAIEDAGTLRDVPVNVVSSVADTPRVLWPPIGPETREDDAAFLVPDATDDPWNQVYVPFSDPSRREPDLNTPLRPVLNGLARAVFPAMKRRMSIGLDGTSNTDRGLQPLRLVADLVGREQAERNVSGGVDLYLDQELDDVPTTVESLSLFDDGDEVAPVKEALVELREHDPRFALEIFDAPAERAGIATHVQLMVRPWSNRAQWVVRLPPDDPSIGTAMVWDPVTESWSALEVEGHARELRPETGEQMKDLPQTNGLPYFELLDQLFQELVIRRWRGEADALPRVLGRSLDASPAHRLGRKMLRAHAEAAEHALRVIVVDPVFGAEVVDKLNQDSGRLSELRERWDTELAPTGANAPSLDLDVTFADYHRPTGWRITVLAKHQPRREQEAARRGLERLFGQEVPDELAEQVFEATHRATPGVLRHLWMLADIEHDKVRERVDAELVGHLGVALFTSCRRNQLDLPELAPEWQWVTRPFPEGTILLSMDALQRWTWTRRGGTRGDFLAVVPAADEKRVRIVAIESKGSANDSTYDGTRQARTALRKLRERFAGPKRADGTREYHLRRDERRELLRCLAQEGFRARGAHRLAHDLVAAGDGCNLDFQAVCVSTALGGSGLHSDSNEAGDEVLWIRCRGEMGLTKLTGRKLKLADHAAPPARESESK